MIDALAKIQHRVFQLMDAIVDLRLPGHQLRLQSPHLRHRALELIDPLLSSRSTPPRSAQLLFWCRHGHLLAREVWVRCQNHDFLHKLTRGAWELQTNLWRQQLTDLRRSRSNPKRLQSQSMGYGNAAIMDRMALIPGCNRNDIDER